MTRKDYKMIAEQIAHCKNHFTEPAEHIEAIHANLEVLSYRLAEAMKADNPRFDIEKFMSAAGFGLK